MKKLPIKEGDYWIDHFLGGASHPYFGVYEGMTLVCVCVYRKGAEEVLRRLAMGRQVHENNMNDTKAPWEHETISKPSPF